MDALRAAGWQVFDTHRVGRGFPDLCCAKDGETVLVEVKSQLGCFTPGELEFHREWRGGRMYVVRSAEDALERLGKL